MESWSRTVVIIKLLLAVGKRLSHIYRAQPIQRSSVVERSAVNRLVVGSNPTAGAIKIFGRKLRRWLAQIVRVRDTSIPKRTPARLIRTSESSGVSACAFE